MGNGNVVQGSWLVNQVCFPEEMTKRGRLTKIQLLGDFN